MSPSGRAMSSPCDADVDPLIDQVRTIAEAEVARQYLEPATHYRGWTVTDGDEVVGRFVWSDEGVAGAPFDVVIDGRILTWGEFRVALGSYEGWNFRLLLEDRVVEARTDATVIDLARRRTTQIPKAERSPRWSDVGAQRAVGESFDPSLRRPSRRSRVPLRVTGAGRYPPRRSGLASRWARSPGLIRQRSRQPSRSRRRNRTGSAAPEAGRR